MESLSPLTDEDEFYDSQESWSLLMQRRSSLAVVEEREELLAAAADVNNATSFPEPKTATSFHEKEFDDITTPAQYDIDDYLTLPTLLSSPATPCARRSLDHPRPHDRAALINEQQDHGRDEQRFSQALNKPEQDCIHESELYIAQEGVKVSSRGFCNIGDQHKADELEERNHLPSTPSPTDPRLDAACLRARLSAQNVTPEQDAFKGSMESDDLFMQEAETHDSSTRSARIDRLLGRTSEDKRRSVPLQEFRPYTSMDDRRPRTSGGGRPATRLGQLQSQHQLDNGMSLSGVNARQRRSSRHDSVSGLPLSPRSPLNERNRSPELTAYGRLRPQPVPRRTPQALEESPVGSLERKQSIPDSTSGDSQTAASTVWDELDDLKSRIKKLELTGKPLAAALISDTSPQMERPRTATTAPTTIDSSPKREQKTDVVAEDIQPEVSQASLATIHPLLHAALIKAKSLLNPALYRSLEVTAGDALQMALMTGSYGQGGAPTTISGSAIDRSLRRKADTMCRNLTDLCLALCEGKHEAATPMSIPSGRLSRAASVRDTGPRGSRPMSRLEARRSSILGDTPSQPSLSPNRDRDSMSVIDTPSQSFERRQQRSSSRFSLARSRFDDIADDDPTVRPPSRNGSEFSSRSRQTLPLAFAQPQRSFSLREALASRRGSGTGNRDLSRVASMSSDAGRRWTRETTPPVLEEDTMDGQSPQLPKQRVSSFSQLRQARGLAMTPLRSSSLSRHAPQVTIE